MDLQIRKDDLVLHNETGLSLAEFMLVRDSMNEKGLRIHDEFHYLRFWDLDLSGTSPVTAVMYIESEEDFEERERQRHAERVRKYQEEQDAHIENFKRSRPWVLFGLFATALFLFLVVRYL